MKKYLVLFILSAFAIDASAQETKLYNPAADVEKDLKTALSKAKAEHKFVLIQAGGNWCSWCIEFARFAKADAKIDSVINSSFVWYHLNYSKENENKAELTKLGFPQRFGFPSFIILNEKGERLHTQNSEYLEDGNKSYSRSKVLSFLEMWTPHALDPAVYGSK